MKKAGKKPPGKGADDDSVSVASDKASKKQAIMHKKAMKKKGDPHAKDAGDHDSAAGDAKSPKHGGKKKEGKTPHKTSTMTEEQMVTVKDKDIPDDDQIEDIESKMLADELVTDRWGATVVRRGERTAG